MTLEKNPKPSETKLKINKRSLYLRVGFSQKKEIFFVAIGSIIGGLTMHLPRIFFDFTTGSQYFVTLLVIAKVLGSNFFFIKRFTKFLRIVFLIFFFKKNH